MDTHRSNRARKRIVHAAIISTAVAQITPYTPGPCDGDMKSATWCDTSLDFVSRAEALVANLTVEEKSGLFLATAKPVERVGWPGYNWWSEALHGVAREGIATSFPQICGVAASYNKTLFHLIGNATGTEARGLNNGAYQSAETGRRFHGLTMWSPNINIFRDPRWGRGQETPGEDPTINGEYAAAFVTGLQGPDPKFLQAAACLKHYATYSQETGREAFAASVTAQDMEDTYLPAFSVGVEQGKAEGMMCSYNAETFGDGVHGNGSAVPSCANHYLLTELAREKWGFGGYVTSDCGALSDIDKNHHTGNGCSGKEGCGHDYSAGIADTVYTALHAGLDTDCRYPGRNGDGAPHLHYMDSQGMASNYANATIAELADTSLARLFATQMRLGFADPRTSVPMGLAGPEVVNTPAHQALAREAADQSLVLLKNAQSTLPLPLASASGADHGIAVVGRNALATTNMQGNYFGAAPYLVSPCEGVTAAVGADRGAVYCDDGGDGGQEVLKRIAAGKLQAVVLVVGLTSEGVAKPASPDEAEGQDRTSLLLPHGQDAYVAKVAAAARQHNVPVAMVVMSGSAVDVSASAQSGDVGAILWCGYPGQSGGTAIADALFGKRNPSGRLSTTWYAQAFADAVKLDDYRMRPDAASGYPGRTHRFYTGTPVFPFGHGLSYTSFEHAPPAVTFRADAASTVSAEAKAMVTRTRSSVVAQVSVRVTNTGGRGGAESVLLFAAPPTQSAEDQLSSGAPLHTLGASTTLSFEVKAHSLTYAARDGSRAAPMGAWRFWTGTAADGAAAGVLAELK